jgi:hypothetical protein
MIDIPGCTLQVRHKATAQNLHRAFRFHPAAFCLYIAIQQPAKGRREYCGCEVVGFAEPPALQSCNM